MVSSRGEEAQLAAFFPVLRNIVAPGLFWARTKRELSVLSLAKLDD